MTHDAPLATATTTSAVAATSQSRDADAALPAGTAIDYFAGEGGQFTLGDGIRRLPAAPYQRKKGDPLYRPLRIYTVDPSASRLEGAIGTINVPFEPLKPGPEGALFSVVGTSDIGCRSADLEHQHVLIASGYQPSPSDPRFHHQMVYAVCSSIYAAFRMALGRSLSWGFGDETTPARLALKPHFAKEQNAYYTNDVKSGSICFGYYPAPKHPTDRSMPGGYVFTCLSHDIIAHEVTHALLDGLRARFSVPSGPDVGAFHEAFADLVAIFQHFSYREVLMVAIRRCKGAVEKAELLRDLARQFGHTTDQKGPLRTAIEADPAHPRQYDEEALNEEAHQRGSILVSAVFEAFVTVFKRKTERIIRLATNGSGVLPPGEISHDLQSELADSASHLASQFLTICIRAIDYCPPVGITYGDYLRALITADYDVVPDDPWDYRGALIDAFWQRNIYPRFATSLSVDALLWKEPTRPLPAVPKLNFADLRFQGDPANAAGAEEVRRQACALGRYVTEDGRRAEFGLIENGDPRLKGDTAGLPCIESLRTARRSGPDGQIVFDLVAEITQVLHVAPSDAGPGFDYYGGCTVILGPDGKIRYLVSKSVTGHDRLKRRREFLASAAGSTYWRVDGDRYRPRPGMFRLSHRQNRMADEA
ncbi:MAG: hypothetical protein ABIV07_12425 [Polaromonas sp.]